MQRLGLWIIMFSAAAGIVTQAPAQPRADTSLLCWRARPTPGCRAFVLTNFGLYVASNAQQYEGQLRVLGDWGVMVNVTRHDAVGASLFLSLDNGGQWRSGPALRYRRWTTARSALELAIGRRGPTPDDRGALFGMVKFSPTPVIGVVLRGETAARSCPVGLCCVCNNTGWVSSARFLAGVELGESPGLLAQAACAVVGGLVYVVTPKRGI